MLLVAQGGKEGRGNAFYATATQQTPYLAERGERGEQYRYALELRLLADVGIVGKPNAGKSTLLSVVSSAKPKIGHYPFTTREPVLGVVTVGWRTFVMTEIPGLLEGAHLGIGLGHEFLRHATRTRVLLHVVDGSVDDVSLAVQELNAELAAYGEGLQDKLQIVVVNKLDLPEVQKREGEIAASLRWMKGPVFFASAAAGTGMEPIMAKAAELLRGIEKPAPMPMAEVAVSSAPRGAGKPVEVVLENGVFVVIDGDVERLVAGSDLTKWSGRAQVKGYLDRLGVTDALEAAGIQHRDTVRFGDIELEW